MYVNYRFYLEKGGVQINRAYELLEILWYALLTASDRYIFL